MNVQVHVEQRTASTAPAALETVLALAAQCGGPCWAIFQSFTEISFVRWPASSLPIDQIFSGRIFGPDAEVRWLREGSDWMIWFTREGAGTAHSRIDRRYYLWDQSDLNRIPGVPDYPLDSPVTGNDRPYIEVYEYEALLADHSSLEAVEDYLNQPRVAAHRFVQLASGHDSKEGIPHGSR